jgi:hypothetical protein
MNRLLEVRQLKTNAVTFAIAMMILAVLSATVLSGFFSSSATYQGAYQKLDEKRDNVMALTASSAGAAALITLLPDDTCTPIASEMTEISKGFAIVIAALLLEKHLLTLLGFGFFALVIPLCCILLAVARFIRTGNRLAVQQAALKLFAFGLILYLAIPISVFISSKIDENYQASIDATVNGSEQISAVIDETSAASEDKDSKTTNTKTSDSELKEADGPFEFLQQQFGNLQSAADSAIKTATGAVDWAKRQMGNYVELFAVMIVTSVIIPVAVPLVLYLVFKILFGQQPVVVPQPTELPSASIRPIYTYKTKDE